jgi:hypothetical protein
MSSNGTTLNNNTTSIPSVAISPGTDIEAQIATADRDKTVLCCPCDTQTCCLVSCATITVLMVITPFIICDLYFAYNDISCQHDSNPIGFNLSTWLAVSGLSMIGFLGLFGILLICVGCKPKGAIPVVVLQYVYSLFSFAWLIVGCVMFWRYLDPSGNCNSNVSNYMWARLIIGLVGVFFSSQNSKKEDK